MHHILVCFTALYTHKNEIGCRHANAPNMSFYHELRDHSLFIGMGMGAGGMGEKLENFPIFVMSHSTTQHILQDPLLVLAKISSSPTFLPIPPEVHKRMNDLLPRPIRHQIKQRRCSVVNMLILAPSHEHMTQEFYIL